MVNNTSKTSILLFTWLWAISPTLIGLLIVVLLAEFQLIEFHFSIHDVDTFILFCGLCITLLISSVLLFREGIRQIKLMSEHQLQIAFANDRVRFLRRLDHEIKNPLMGIKTALDNLEETTDPVQHQAIRIAINEQIDRLTRLVSDLRRIGDMEHHEIEQLPVDMNILLNDVLGMIKDDELANCRNLQFELDNSLHTIIGDYDLLLLAVHNILTNAIKYTNTDDLIQIATRTEAGQFIICITDTGPVISPEDLPYIWDELYRSNQVKNIPGSGIGLALVRKIVERHKGKVTLTSTPQTGTQVELRLPIEPQES